MESAAVASLPSSSPSSQPNLVPLQRPKTTRKPVPSIFIFPADNNSHRSDSTSQQLQAGHSPAVTAIMAEAGSQYNRTITMSSPLPSPPSSQRLTPRSPHFGSAGPALPLSPSTLTRNASVPASLFQHHTRPSLSSPSPPTPLVPSIPLRHATQHSPSQPTYTITPLTPIPLTPKTPSSVASSYAPRGSLDRQLLLKKPPPPTTTAEQGFTTSFATTSDPNLPSTSATPVITSLEPPSYHPSLPLKQLLAKLAVPASQMQMQSYLPTDVGTGGESDMGSRDSYHYATCAPLRRSASVTSGSISPTSVQFATTRRNSDISVIELATIRSFQQTRSSPGLFSKQAGGRSGYHYRRRAAGEGVQLKDGGVVEKKENEVKAGSDVGEGEGLWPDWRGHDSAHKEQPVQQTTRKSKAKDEQRPPQRNVLVKRRPSNSTKNTTPNPSSSKPGDLTHSTSSANVTGTVTRLSRSLSSSSLFKRAGLFTSRSPNSRTVSPLPPPQSSSTYTSSGSPVMGRTEQGVNLTDRSGSDTSHGERISVYDQSILESERPSHEVPGVRETLTSMPTPSGLVALESPVSKQHFTAPSSSASDSGGFSAVTTSTGIVTAVREQYTETRLSTISSEESQMTTRPHSQSRDNANMNHVRELVNEEEEGVVTTTSTTTLPVRSPRPPSFEFPPTVGDSPLLSPPAQTSLLEQTNNKSPLPEDTSRGERSSGSGGSALSYADVPNSSTSIIMTGGGGGMQGTKGTEGQGQVESGKRDDIPENTAMIPIGERKPGAVAAPDKGSTLQHHISSEMAQGSSVTKEISTITRSRESLDHSPPPQSQAERLGPGMASPSSSLAFMQRPCSRDSSALVRPARSPLPPRPRTAPQPTSPLSPTSPFSSATRKSNKLRKSRHASDQGDITPYYTVVGSRNDQVFPVGGPRDSFGATSGVYAYGYGFSPEERATWGVRTTISAAPEGDGGKEKMSIGKSLSRKLSGKFTKSAKKAGEKERERESEEKVKDWEGVVMSRGRASTWQDDRVRPATSPKETFDKDKYDSDDRCLPYLYSVKKQAQSEMDMSTKAGEGQKQKVTEEEKEKENGGMFPRFWKLFGRTKSRERSGSAVDEDGDKTDKRPPLPALPKDYVNDIYTPTYSRQDPPQLSSPRTHKSPRPKSSKSSPAPPSISARPSTATRSSTSDVPSPPFWNRSDHSSARSSVSSLVPEDRPPMPSPLPDLKRYVSMDDTINDSRGSRFTRAASSKGSPQTTHVGAEEPNNINVIERCDSPPIPLFSTCEPINSFPKRSSDQRLKSSSPTSPTPSATSTVITTATSTPSPGSTSPPPRPAKSPSRPKIVNSRTNSFNDEALYPPVMNKSSSTRSIPKMTFREIDSREAKKRQMLTEKEKADRWNALLEKSDAAGGTLHFGGGDDKLPSDELRFSRTLSELARDDA